MYSFCAGNMLSFILVCIFVNKITIKSILQNNRRLNNKECENSVLKLVFCYLKTVIKNVFPLIGIKVSFVFYDFSANQKYCDC